MKFSEVVAQASALLQRKGRITYRALQREFELDEEALADLKDELIDAEQVARDENGKVLVWIGQGRNGETEKRGKGETGQIPTVSVPDSQTDRLKDSRREVAERRQLTVMFCDLVGSTTLSELLDPEELREVVQAYHARCAEAINRYAGFTAQHLGDGLLVYFGYPEAHEDEAVRAVRTALEILAGLQLLNARLRPALKARLPHSIQVRIGVHTGLVVIGEIGSSEKRELLALGETPNLAARLQGLAEPDTVVISAVTQQLLAGLFEYQELGAHPLKGLSNPVTVYCVTRESGAQSRFAAAANAGLTPLAGREEELSVLRARWEQAKANAGQVVLLNGEPGIGKSRLARELKELVSADGATRVEFQCSPYHQNSALYPIIDHWQRLLQFTREDTPATKLEKLQQVLARYRFPQADTVPLLATLLSLPHPEGFPPITLSPQKQKEKTQSAVVSWLVEEAETAAVLCVWEDLHWVDPSTLEVLALLLDQIPTTRMLLLLTSRPEFSSPWSSRSYLTHLTLNRLGQSQVEVMISQVAAGTPLPAEVIEQIRAKTDGVPLFVEELTKSVIESGGVQPAARFTIPATLQDSLMARLDRLGPAKEIAQLGATLGREFSYELLYAVAHQDEGRLQQGLRQLVEAELLYQRGLPPQATYLFKHALIQDTAYQSLLKSRRQQLHQHIAQVLEGQFAETKETQPDLLAHHYTEAGLIEQAIPCWQQAGQLAAQRSANQEAIAHLNKGLELLMTRPDTPERVQQELALQLALSQPLIATHGYAAPAVEYACSRALELCRQLGVTPYLPYVLIAVSSIRFVRAEHQTARELAVQCLRLPREVYGQDLAIWAHYVVGASSFCLGEFALARAHLEQGIALYTPEKDDPFVSKFVQDPRISCLSYAAYVLGFLGYPSQGQEKARKALTLAQDLAHPFSLAFAFNFAVMLDQLLREVQAGHEWTEALVNLSREQEFPYWLAWGTIQKGWALALQGPGEEGVIQIRQGLSAWRATGAEMWQSHFLAMLADACGKAGQSDEGLNTLSEALTLANKTEERFYEAELYRLKGELTLQSSVQRLGSSVPNTQPLTPSTHAEAEACFLKAIEVSQKQQAKSLELRATMSLARLWQSQGKRHAAHNTLSEIYHWFTEGFDTKDLQEAKRLIEELS